MGSKSQIFDLHHPSALSFRITLHLFIKAYSLIRCDAVDIGACGSTLHRKSSSIMRDNKHYSTLRKVAPGFPKAKVKQSHYRPGVAQRVPGS